MTREHPRVITARTGSASDRRAEEETDRREQGETPGNSLTRSFPRNRDETGVSSSVLFLPVGLEQRGHLRRDRKILQRITASPEYVAREDCPSRAGRGRRRVRDWVSVHSLPQAWAACGTTALARVYYPGAAPMTGMLEKSTPHGVRIPADPRYAGSCACTVAERPATSQRHRTLKNLGPASIELQAGSSISSHYLIIGDAE